MTSTTPDRPPLAARAWAALAVLCAFGVVAALTLAPRSVVAPAHGLFRRLAVSAAEPLVRGSLIADERFLNMLLFVPLGATIALLLGGRRWPLAIMPGFVLSAAVEWAQGRIPGRVPDGEDVLWNSIGAGVGALAVGLLFTAFAAARAGARTLKRREASRRR